MKDLSLLHIAFIYLAVINVVTFSMYGVDKWKHKKFRYGVPMILIAQIALLFFTSCKTKHSIETVLPIQHEYTPEHSPSVLIVMYDQETGKEPLMKAVKEYKAEVIYGYSIIPDMAIKKPVDKTLEETMQYFKKVKGVVSVEYDHVYHLTNPVKPKLEIK